MQTSDTFLETPGAMAKGKLVCGGGRPRVRPACAHIFGAVLCVEDLELFSAFCDKPKEDKVHRAKNHFKHFTAMSAIIGKVSAGAEPRVLQAISPLGLTVEYKGVDLTGKLIVAIALATLVPQFDQAFDQVGKTAYFLSAVFVSGQGDAARAARRVFRGALVQGPFEDEAARQKMDKAYNKKYNELYKLGLELRTPSGDTYLTAFDGDNSIKKKAIAIIDGIASEMSLEDVADSVSIDGIVITIKKDVLDLQQRVSSLEAAQVENNRRLNQAHVRNKFQAEKANALEAEIDDLKPKVTVLLSDVDDLKRQLEQLRNESKEKEEQAALDAVVAEDAARKEKEAEVKLQEMAANKMFGEIAAAAEVANAAAVEAAKARAQAEVSSTAASTASKQLKVLEEQYAADKKQLDAQMESYSAGFSDLQAEVEVGYVAAVKDVGEKFDSGMKAMGEKVKALTTTVSDLQKQLKSKDEKIIMLEQELALTKNLSKENVAAQRKMAINQQGIMARMKANEKVHYRV